ncbi:hypothetical protein SCATT_20400 [Streptantibioticus cattleyicolor NRRL 8057 = DSM 46488]|uniref:Uncharacterized protein n=1 Tax=Streptantibioticus cattleyicolor (strain ATCC 35852 / DSM 46488 / JCM 4925 / NBRC 14057 / NRRL 8057) TaxID=1003195 RepID=G8WWK3_STREN|nr:hypothetical protein SCATT_20400 [Streptantibioticus cattleyicolor NRRL 8057 = DSM 46488]
MRRPRRGPLRGYGRLRTVTAAVRPARIRRPPYVWHHAGAFRLAVVGPTLGPSVHAVQCARCAGAGQHRRRGCSRTDGLFTQSCP